VSKIPHIKQISNACNVNYITKHQPHALYFPFNKPFINFASLTFLDNGKFLRSYAGRLKSYRPVPIIITDCFHLHCQLHASFFREKFSAPNSPNAKKSLLGVQFYSPYICSLKVSYLQNFLALT